MSANEYMNEFVQLSCAPELLEAKIFPNAKEITESMGMFHAALWDSPATALTTERPGMSACGENHIAVVVGDGSTPRTGALLAYRTRWDVYSIDPNLKEKDWHIKRLTTLVSKAEDIDKLNCEGRRCYVFFPHSHAPMAKALERIVNWSERRVIAMPCCYEIEGSWARRPHIAYQDLRVTSPKNWVHIWWSKT